jgi:hypothetical protein
MLDSGAGLSYVSPAYVGKHVELAAKRGKRRSGTTTTGEKVAVTHYSVGHVIVGEESLVACLALVPTPPGADVVIGRDLMKAHHWIVCHRTNRVLAHGRVVNEGGVERKSVDENNKKKKKMSAPGGSGCESEEERNGQSEDVPIDVNTNTKKISAPGGSGCESEEERNGQSGEVPIDAKTNTKKMGAPGRSGCESEEKRNGQSEDVPIAVNTEKTKKKKKKKKRAKEEGKGTNDEGSSGAVSVKRRSNLSGPSAAWRPLAGGPRRPARTRRLPHILRDETFALGKDAQAAMRRSKQQASDEEYQAEMLTALFAMGIEETDAMDEEASKTVGDESETKFVESLKNRYADFFSEKLTRQPPLRKVNFSVELAENAKALPHRAPYPLSAEKARALQDIVDDMASAGLIARHDGPASCPMFLVKKKTLPGEKPRFRAVLDARPRNEQTTARPFAAPRVDMELPKLKAAKVMSCVDATQAFYQVRIEPGQEHLFSFCDPAETVWKMLCMPMGCSNSMAFRGLHPEW